MRNPKIREMMAELYKLVEKYEVIPPIALAEGEESYFKELAEDVVLFSNKWDDDAFARKFIVALFEAVEARFLAEKNNSKKA